MRGYRVPIILGIFISGSSIIWAHSAQLDYCSTVLQEKAFNTESVSTRYDILLTLRDNLCKSDYSSDQEASNAVKAAGFNVGYGGFSLGGSKSSNNSSEKISIESTEFCQLSAMDFQSRLEFYSSKTDTNTAVGAWSNCIKELGGDDIYLKYKVMADGNGIIGDLLWSKKNGIRQITSADIIADDNIKLTCRVAGETLPNGPIDPPLIVATESTGASCRKSGDGFAAVQFQTSSGSTGYVELLSQKEIEAREWERLSTSLSGAEARLKSLEDREKELITAQEVDQLLAQLREDTSRLLPFRTKTAIIYTDVQPQEAPNPPGVRREGRFYVLDLMPAEDGVCFMMASADANRPNIGIQKIVIIENNKWVLKATRDADVGFGFVGASCILQTKL